MKNFRGLLYFATPCTQSMCPNLRCVVSGQVSVVMWLVRYIWRVVTCLTRYLIAWASLRRITSASTTEMTPTKRSVHRNCVLYTVVCNRCREIVIIIIMSVFIAMSAWLGYYENSLGSFDECWLSAMWSPDQASELGLRLAIFYYYCERRVMLIFNVPHRIEGWVNLVAKTFQQ